MRTMDKRTRGLFVAVLMWPVVGGIAAQMVVGVCVCDQHTCTHKS